MLTFLLFCSLMLKSDKQLVTKLGDDDWYTREQATRVLIARQTLYNNTDTKRLFNLLDLLDAYHSDLEIRMRCSRVRTALLTNDPEVCNFDDNP